MESDRVYFSRRAEEERARAESAIGEQARQAHIEMAFRYEELAAALYHSERLIENLPPPRSGTGEGAAHV